MPQSILTQSILLPEMELKGYYRKRLHVHLNVGKKRIGEYCPRCATLSNSGYDTRKVRLKDAPLRNRAVTLYVTKRRLYCKPCKRPFTEPLRGVRKGRRTTERYRRDLLWACENYTDLKKVKRTFRCSSGFVYQALYEQLELKRRKNLYPWPKVIGIDEHSFRRNKKLGRTEFASMVVDYKNNRVLELVQGKTKAELLVGLEHIKERENVDYVILDLCDPFKNFALEYFPNAKLVADKFHVLRLLTPALNRRRKAIAGDRRKNAIGRLLLRNGYKLDYFRRGLVQQWLGPYPELKEVYEYKERLHRLYRTRGYEQAAEALTKLTDEMALSTVPEITTLRKTLIRWRREILAYFSTGLTNGRTEGYNNLAKLIQRRAFGYKSFQNYRLRLLSACA